LEIEDGLIKIVVLQKYFGKLNIKLLKTLECEEISSMNTVTDIEKVSKLIKNEISDIKLPFRRVAYAVQNENIINRNIKIINTDHKEDIQGLIKYELNQYMPINIEDYILKYKSVETKEDKVNTQVILMPRSISQNYKELSKSLKLKAVKLGVNFNVLQTLINKNLVSIDNNINIVLDIKQNTTNVNIVKDKIIFSSHTVPNDNVLEFIYTNIKEFKNIYYYGISKNEFIDLLQQEINIRKLSLNNINHSSSDDLNNFISNIGLVY
jgi:type IV pilus assembly protein PilM